MLFRSDEYLNTSNNMNWGICGINLRKEDSKNFENLKLRKGKYILKTISTSGDEKYKDINSIIKLIDWSKEKDEAIISKIVECNTKGQPLLVFTSSINKSEV